MTRLVEYTVICIVLLLPLSVHCQLLSCIAGTSVMTLSFNSTESPPSETCPEDEAFGCIRVDATAAFLNSRDETEIVTTAFGQCVSEDTCVDACSDAIRQLIFDEINSAVQLDPDTLEVQDCEAACCNTPDCNALSVAELLAARGGSPNMSSSPIVMSLLAAVMLVLSKIY